MHPRWHGPMWASRWRAPTWPWKTADIILVRSNPLGCGCDYQARPSHLPQDGAKPHLGNRLQYLCIPLAAGALLQLRLAPKPGDGRGPYVVSTVIVAINARLLHVAH